VIQLPIFCAPPKGNPQRERGCPASFWDARHTTARTCSYCLPPEELSPPRSFQGSVSDLIFQVTTSPVSGGGGVEAHAPRRPHRNLMINSVPYDWDDAQLTTFFSSYGLLEAGGPMDHRFLTHTQSRSLRNPISKPQTRGPQYPKNKLPKVRLSSTYLVSRPTVCVMLLFKVGDPPGGGGSPRPLWIRPKPEKKIDPLFWAEMFFVTPIFWVPRDHLPSGFKRSLVVRANTNE